MNTPCYVPSGRLPLRAVILTLVCAVLIVFPAWIYAWLTIRASLFIVDVLALLGFALGMGVAVHHVARIGKARNPLWMGRLGLLVGIVGWYAQWAACVAILTPKNWLAGPGSTWPDSHFAALLANPQAVWEFALTWSDARGYLILLWIVEFLCLITIPRLRARHAAKARFCESTNTWAATSDTSAQAPVQDPHELVAAIGHLSSDRFEEALDSATAHSTAQQHGLRIDALRVCALATAGLGHWPVSLTYWKNLFEEERSALNALQIGTTCAMCGAVDEGTTWIALARELNATSRELPDSQIGINFISALVQAGHTAQALPYLDEMRAVYISLGMTEPTRLHVLQIPMFSVFLENSLPIVGTTLGKDEARGWYAAMLPHLDVPGQHQLTSWLERHFVSMPSASPAEV